MSIKLTAEKLKMNRIPRVARALKEAGEIYAAEYASRIVAGQGVEHSFPVDLAPNATWVQQLKGHNSPLIGSGGMANSIVSKVSGDTVTISHSKRTVAGGVNGKKASTYAEVARRMQVGGRYFNVYIKYPGKKAVTRDSVDVQARPHFFTTVLDRRKMAEPVHRLFRLFLRKGFLKR